MKSVWGKRVLLATLVLGIWTAVAWFAVQMAHYDVKHGALAGFISVLVVAILSGGLVGVLLSWWE